MASIDIAELRRLEKAVEPAPWIMSDIDGWIYSQKGTRSIGGLESKKFVIAFRNVAPALLDRLEYLEKIAERVPEKCCLTCAKHDIDCGYLMLNKINKCPVWLPLDGEKEE